MAPSSGGSAARKVPRVGRVPPSTAIARVRCECYGRMSGGDRVPTGHGRSASGNALLALGGQWGGRYAIQLLALVVFSRLLSPPADFGLVAMVTGVAGIAYAIGDFGLSLAALQAEQLNAPPQRTNLFWFNSGIGLVVAAAVASRPDRWLRSMVIHGSPPRSPPY